VDSVSQQNAAGDLLRVGAGWFAHEGVEAPTARVHAKQRRKGKRGRWRLEGTKASPQEKGGAVRNLFMCSGRKTTMEES